MIKDYLELEMMISALGSRGVAIEVTQPLWPSKVPRKDNCSAILNCGKHRQVKKNKFVCESSAQTLERQLLNGGLSDKAAAR